MASQKDFQSSREGGQVQIEPSDSEKPSETGNKSGDPGRTPEKAEGEDDSSTTDSRSQQ